jgi:2-polyprenyl-3-methyl-5-hydroxy-6-metoxy-1,4-benzoquinol methylase
VEQDTKLFAPSRTPLFEDCYFYHCMDIPGHGSTSGAWDLRGREANYLGGIALDGARVLEIGTASGHLCFWMERNGAEVVAYDLDDKEDWDIVPYHGQDTEGVVQGRRAHIRRLNNSWWYAHERFRSRARVAYGTVYSLPPALGTFDVVTLGSILLHLRDPFLALQRAAALSREALVVTDWWPSSARERALVAALESTVGRGRVIRFVPDAAARKPWETWWVLSPEFLAEALGILGFGNLSLSRHTQAFQGREVELYTLVGRRSAAIGSVEVHPRNLSCPFEEELMKAIPVRRLVRHVIGRVRRRMGLG